MDDNTVSIIPKDLVHPIAFLLSTMSMALPCGVHTCGWCTSTFCPGSTSCHSWSGWPTSCEPRETEIHDLIFLILHLDHSEVAISFATSVKRLATPYVWPSLNFSLFGISLYPNWLVFSKNHRTTEPEALHPSCFHLVILIHWPRLSSLASVSCTEPWRIWSRIQACSGLFFPIAVTPKWSLFILRWGRGERDRMRLQRY